MDRCHVVGDVIDDAQLGRFYAKNNFIPELVEIGKEMREAEGGVFIQYGYVVRHDGLKPYTDPIGTIPQAPNYIFRLSLHSLMDTKRVSTLDLPASMGQIMRAVEECGSEQFPLWNTG